VLDHIDDVGPKRKQQLLKHFGSVKKIREASELALQEAGIPANLASQIYSYFQQESLSKE
ncbi:helix-hairpin-helix domain-containing protein, partial [Lysinibacillus fusiformis]|uniref:helix-hairpin-helix domain-containing protein n=1 Tax=Lysinibacillus fusiformis TaxID=28031 RepID=UPI0020BEA306